MFKSVFHKLLSLNTIDKLSMWGFPGNISSEFQFCGSNAFHVKANELSPYILGEKMKDIKGCST